LYDRRVMPTPSRTPVQTLIERLAPNLRYPYLFAAVVVLFVADLFFPDPLPFVDEVMLALLTFLVGSWRTRRKEPGEVVEVSPSTSGSQKTGPGPGE
jgi:hypothetical protein